MGSVCVPELECNTPNLWKNKANHTDMMPTEIGACNYDTGVVTLKDAWAIETYGAKPASVWLVDTIPVVSTTQYCDMSTAGCSCGNVACNIQATPAYLKHAKLDGVAAIPPRMYGTWSDRGDQCISNRNICYELTNADGKVFTIGVVGRCGGYVQCVSADEGVMKKLKKEYKAVEVLNQSAVTGAVGADANACLTSEGYITAGTTPSCAVTNFAKDAWNVDKCYDPDAKDNKGSNIDWCASNLHPHFDMDLALQNKFCGPGAGTCNAKHVKAVLCPVWDTEVRQGHVDSEKGCEVNSAGFECNNAAGRDKCKRVQDGICCADYLKPTGRKLPEVKKYAVYTTCEDSPWSCGA